MRYRPVLAAGLLAGCLILLTGPSPGQDAASKLVLLNVGAGQLPPDTAQENKSKLETVTDVKDIGPKALKVTFSPGDAFGSRGGLNQNWKKFAALRFDAFNPGKDPVDLELNVSHARTTGYQTRVVFPIKLKPGKTEVKIGIDEMTNVNGSAPDLAKVQRWNISDPGNKGPTLYFGDIYLEGGDAASGAPAAGGGGGAAMPAIGPLIPAGGIRIKGKVGTVDVDLTITPLEPPKSSNPPATRVPVKGDPARLERIRAAKMPPVTAPISFDTPEADAVMSALEVFPPDNPFNLVVEDWPLHPASKQIVAGIGADKPLRYNPDMGFVLVPPDFKKVDVKVVEYPHESDKGPFPVPDNVPIEGWPVGYKDKKVTLEDVQRNVLKEEADRHGIVLDPTSRMLYEFFQLRRTDGGWEAAQASVFDLKSNKLRADGWTSADAAGLPILPAVVRHDELKRGAVEHALRVTVRKTRRAYVYPATHYASRLEDENLPRMGERLRLRKDFDVSGFSPEAQAILNALKKYGMFVADNGIEWAISCTPDPRIPVLHDEFRKVKGSDFEVVVPPPGYKPPE
ncbi:MAG TPA: hypothetical protein VKE40_12740 [Gemmataceae bacterium]|nr:hypothetical protein [Gemmataceae bacterium]